MRRRRTSAKGFTLLEILIVLSIIALLAALIFPVFPKVRERSRQASCASNLRQIGLPIGMYAQDFDDGFTRAWLFGVNDTR